MRLNVPDGGTLEVKIPAGIETGQVLRLRGKGGPGRGTGKAGDALVEVEVMPHRFFTRTGVDIHLELPISLSEAVLGGEVPVPTPTGPVMMRVPKNANTGATLRLKGKGVRRRGGGHGDELVRLRVMLPPAPDPELEKFAAGWQAGKSYASRAGRCSHDDHPPGIPAARKPRTKARWRRGSPEEWLIPGGAATEPAFTDADIARAALIRDLRHDLAVNDPGIGVILSLIDQVHGLRRTLADVLRDMRERGGDRAG